MDAIIIWITAYLIGSIPCGVLIARLKNINIREHGSGNIGAANVARTLGKKEGALTLLGDCSKGFLAVGLASRVLEDPAATALAGFMAFAGHLFSVFLKFKGGKGVATGLGVFIYLMPAAALCSTVVFAVTMAATRYVSMGSMVAALSLSLFGLLFKMPPPYIYASLAIALLIIQRHHDNIKRLLTGTESKFLRK